MGSHGQVTKLSTVAEHIADLRATKVASRRADADVTTVPSTSSVPALARSNRPSAADEDFRCPTADDRGDGAPRERGGDPSSAWTTGRRAVGHR
jgi:hypothetical protein